MADPIYVELLGERHAVTLPSYIEREELAAAYREVLGRKGITVLRAHAAVVGLCTRIGRHSGADFAKHRFDVLAYGGEVYGWLREQKASPAEISVAANAILVPLTEALFPRDAEIEAARGN